MSEEKRVKGWAVKWVPKESKTETYWLESLLDKICLATKRGRGLFQLYEADQWVEARGDGLVGKYVVVKVTAKPKALKPDKLEQAIAEVANRVAVFEAGKRDGLANGNCYNALRCDHYLAAASSVLEFLRGLR